MCITVCFLSCIALMPLLVSLELCKVYKSPLCFVIIWTAPITTQLYWRKTFVIMNWSVLDTAKVLLFKNEKSNEIKILMSAHFQCWCHWLCRLMVAALVCGKNSSRGSSYVGNSPWGLGWVFWFGDKEQNWICRLVIILVWHFCLPYLLRCPLVCCRLMSWAPPIISVSPL